MKARTRGNLLLLVCAFIWGVAFVAQSVGMEYIGPFTFSAVRMFLGALALLPAIAWMDRKKAGTSTDPRGKWGSGPLVLGGIVCGVVLFIAGNLQQFGMQDTSPGKAGFITALYIVIVPIMGLLMKKRTSIQVWVGVILAAVGLYLLCIQEDFHMERGDLLVLLSALFFAAHILVIDRFSPGADGVRLSCIQFLVCGLLSAVCMILFEEPTWRQILACGIPLLYSGILSCGVAYTFQVLGQKETSPSVASLILSLEAVFSVLAGWVLLGQSLTLKEGMGATLVFLATILAQVPLGRFALKKWLGKKV